MPPPDTNRPATPAGRLADRLFDALRAVRRASPSADHRVYLTGVDRGGGYTAQFVTVAAAFLVAVAPTDGPYRVFLYGSEVKLEVTTGRDQPGLVSLAHECDVTRSAPALLANILLCRVEREDAPPVEFALPPSALAALLNCGEVRVRLPRVELYVCRPVYSPAYVLLGPGYHPAERVLVHGPAVEPDVSPLPTGATTLDRLPPHLRALLSGFCFATDADLANAVGLLVTGLLVNLFVEKGKPIALVDGNQPGVGKSLLILVIAVILDGRVPQVIHYTAAEEELQKRICATLRSGEQSVLLIDNAKEDNGTAVSSPTIEANSVAPEISLRVLGTSTNYRRPNDVIWALTMNSTRVSPDLISRGLPIRLEYDGPPEARRFAGPHPLDYAREHRLEILGELAGMVERWTAAGRPAGTRGHRLTHWAEVVGGVLAANGLTEFLANYQEAAADFDAAHDELTALFELAAAEPNGPVCFVPTAPAGGDLPDGAADRAWPAERWAGLLDRAGVTYTSGGPAAAKKAIPAGRWLAARLRRSVPITAAGRLGEAELRHVDGRAKSKKYLLLAWHPEADTPPGATPAEPAVVVTPPSPPPPADGGNGEDWWGSP